MTENKRFTFEKNTGLKNDEVFVVIDNNTDEVFSLENERESNSLVIRMNELAEEIEHLRKYNNELLKKPLLTDILPNAIEIMTANTELEKENEQLNQSVNNLKETILKITIAYQRKHDNTIVNLVDEVHEEDITDLIKELKE